MIRALIMLLTAGCALFSESHKKIDASQVTKTDVRDDQHKDTDVDTVVVKAPDEIFEYDGPNLKKHVLKGGTTTTTKKHEAWQDSSAGTFGAETTLGVVEDVSFSVKLLAWLGTWWPWLLGGIVAIAVFVAIKLRLWRLIPGLNLISETKPPGPDTSSK